ncbi:hypothetical protein D3870_18490 [Noviherbaspirillum cavernae]|uniref:Uncharacterized protein n=1 Tax=Noviherbaspirillum cavernae TaxID=2320862 RepID=A0A418WWJ9_9BURK|nr:hypothetical protein D3870_00080 [Noviherbaspirillum cavernae]RJG07714.1 hypothetical protein D3870_18465 [Noviherbaspirillum cavernae]RJG07717.1 hypothetical protein D3870_18490 [Noviherbaspirillum cavernae]
MHAVKSQRFVLEQETCRRTLAHQAVFVRPDRTNCKRMCTWMVASCGAGVGFAQALCAVEAGRHAHLPRLPG